MSLWTAGALCGRAAQLRCSRTPTCALRSIVLETDSLAIANRVLMKVSRGWRHLPPMCHRLVIVRLTLLVHQQGAGGEAQLTDWAQIASVARESVVRAFAK